VEPGHKINLQGLKFAFFSHEVEGATGFPEAFGTYLQDAGADLVYIRFPFFNSKTKSIWIERFKGRTLLSKKRSWIRFYKPQLVSFVKDFGWLMTVGWTHAIGSDFVLASNNLMGLAALILRRMGLIKRFAYLVVDYSPRRFSQGWVEAVYVYLDRLVATHADSVWTMSLAMLEGRERDGRFKLSELNYRLAPMGNNAHATFAHGPVEFRARDLVFVGNPNAKNVRADFLLDVAVVLRARGEKFRLLFVGPGNVDKLREKTDTLKLNDWIVFHGSIPDPLEFELFMAGCGVGLAPYDPHLEDNFSKFADPSKIKIYLGCSLPVVTTDVPPIAKELAANGCGVIAKFTAEAFAECIIQLWSDDLAFQRARQSALHMGLTFSWPSIFDRLMIEEGFAHPA
jgi:glycosyltransferase involved in cell wall biosynthesis